GRQMFARLETATGLRPGDFVTVRIEERELQDVARVPARAVGGDNAVLKIGENERLESFPVDIVRRQADDVLIRASGLSGQEIVAERMPLLGAGVLVRPLRGTEDAPAAPEEPERISLTEERRARLIAFVEGNTRMPAQAKERVLGQLRQAEVPARVVQRIESRMGG
ncbi:MAG: efflux transporter periplasmic adaptor subunit, partial [Pseudomonadota bacterium]